MTNPKLIPLRLIRIVMNMSAKEMANSFGISTPYISSMENGNRKINDDILIKGLTNLGIELEDYEDLDEFCDVLMESDLDYQNQYRYALMKALGVVSPSFKSETESFLQMFFISNALDIATYIKEAQEYDINEIDGSIIIMPKKISVECTNQENKSISIHTKYASLHRLGLTLKEYQELNDQFSSISKLEIKEESKCKLLLVLGMLNPEHKQTLDKMVEKIIDNDLNKTKKLV